MTSLSGNKTVSSTIYSTASTTNNNLIITNLSFANIEAYEISGNIIQFNTLNLLSNIVAPNLQGNVIGSIIGNITAAQTANIGNLVVGNITVNGTVICQADVDSGNLIASNVNCGNLYCGGNLVLGPGTLGSTITQSSLTSFGTLGNLAFSGNIVAANVLGNLWVGGNLALSPGVLGSTITQSSLTSFGTLSSLNVSGSISCGSEVDSGNLVAANVNAGNVYCGGNLVIGPGALGSTVTTSSLSTLGNLVSMQTTGNVSTSGGRIFVGGASIPSTVNLTQGTYMTWNNETTGESNFINKYGSGTGGFFFYTSPGSGNTYGTANAIATITNSGVFANIIAANNNLSVGTTTIPSGFVFRTLGFASLQQVCFQVTSTPSNQITYPTSYFQGNYSGTATISLMPSYYSTATYGLQTSGTYNGHVVVPVSGIYAVSSVVRWQDNTSSTLTGMEITSYNGSTHTLLLPGDGQTFPGADTGGRRGACQSFLANIAAGVGIATSSASGAGAMYVNWASLSVQLVHAI